MLGETGNITREALVVKTSLPANIPNLDLPIWGPTKPIAIAGICRPRKNRSGHFWTYRLVICCEGVGTHGNSACVAEGDFGWGV
jgi:hypothetical protein